MSAAVDPSVVDRLRRAGCVFAEQEAAVLTSSVLTPPAAPSPAAPLPVPASPVPGAPVQGAPVPGSPVPGAERAAATRPHPTAAATRLEALVQRRVAGEPLEHLVGWVDFAGLRLAVGPGAFVPRQRSRHLARRTLAAARRTARPVVVEVCAGVAPIAAVVARALPAAEVHAADVDPVPLALAARNLPGTAQVHCGPLLDALPPELRGRLDVVAAVPPYVPADAVHLLPREAREHEPMAALLGGADGLEHVRALLVQAATWLAPAGHLLLELHPTQVQRLTRRAASGGWHLRSWTSPDGQTGVVSLRRHMSA